ncbi:MAG: hypothetical protein WAK61_02390 [Leclercia sp.]
MLQNMTDIAAQAPSDGRYNETASAGVVTRAIGITITENKQLINNSLSINGQVQNVKLNFRLLNRLMENSVEYRFQ